MEINNVMEMRIQHKHVTMKNIVSGILVLILVKSNN